MSQFFIVARIGHISIGGAIISLIYGFVINFERVFDRIIKDNSR